MKCGDRNKAVEVAFAFLVRLKQQAFVVQHNVSETLTFVTELNEAASRYLGNCNSKIRVKTTLLGLGRLSALMSARGARGRPLDTSGAIYLYFLPNPFM